MASQSTTPSNIDVNPFLTQHMDRNSRVSMGEEGAPEEKTVDEEEDVVEEPAITDECDVTQCLFCNIISNDFDANLEHMSNGHGLFIPERQRLVVDLETLVGYFHFVIFAYRECLYCGSQKTTREAVQSHMRDKGHCKFDIADEDSEFRDFYDISSGDDHNDSDDSEEKQTVPNSKGNRIGSQLMQADEGFVRLASGKVLAQRSYRAPHSSKPVAGSSQRQGSLPSSSHRESSPTYSDTAVTPSGSGTLSKSRKRNLAVSHQLSNLRPEDRQQLMHLPAYEQRAVLATQKKQLDKQRRTEQWMRGRLERKGNKTLMKHFVNDVPGRSNG
ncbi:c2h2 finger domain-containing protein [Hypoxylon rubiginosum]|uniref:C2h2 finger domain-containing protein n=1 Tax=Hypoxylon rubiginosum TaxID=110542 RepID=A0ACC0CLI3_9PEZI|nr:c2h2 finger domain-containing protein [Hypoxylon rubiginosum]